MVGWGVSLCWQLRHGSRGLHEEDGMRLCSFLFLWAARQEGHVCRGNSGHTQVHMTIAGPQYC